MALGAVLISLPMALTLAVYACAVQGTPAAYGILLYAIAGTLIMTSYTAFQGFLLDDPR